MFRKNFHPIGVIYRLNKDLSDLTAPSRGAIPKIIANSYSTPTGCQSLHRPYSITMTPLARCLFHHITSLISTLLNISELLLLQVRCAKRYTLVIVITTSPNFSSLSFKTHSIALRLNLSVLDVASYYSNRSYGYDLC